VQCDEPATGRSLRVGAPRQGEIMRQPALQG